MQKGISSKGTMLLASELDPRPMDTNLLFAVTDSIMLLSKGGKGIWALASKLSPFKKDCRNNLN